MLQSRNRRFMALLVILIVAAGITLLWREPAGSEPHIVTVRSPKANHVKENRRAQATDVLMTEVEQDKTEAGHHEPARKVKRSRSRKRPSRDDERHGPENVRSSGGQDTALPKASR